MIHFVVLIQFLDKYDDWDWFSWYLVVVPAVVPDGVLDGVFDGVLDGVLVVVLVLVTVMVPVVFLVVTKFSFAKSNFSETKI